MRAARRLANLANQSLKPLFCRGFDWLAHLRSLNWLANQSRCSRPIEKSLPRQPPEILGVATFPRLTFGLTAQTPKRPS